MRIGKDLVGGVAGRKGRGGTRRRQTALAVAALALAACSSKDKIEQGTVGFVEGYLGGVVADEPRAVLIGRDILSAGGSATDAAVAVAFAMSVTLPSSAGLGGGGVCLVHDRKTKTVEAIDFVARVPAARPFNAVPGLPRGLFALHAKHGRLRWEQLLGPAENLARFGIPVSRALARDLQKAGPALAADPFMQRTFMRRDGAGTLREGDQLVQTDLSATIGSLRNQGPGDFYTGRYARVLSGAAAQAGGSLTLEDLRAFVPRWVPTIAVPFGNRTVHFPPPPAAAGAVAAQMWGMLAGRDRYEDAPAEERPHLLAETALRAFADRSRWLKPDGTSTVPEADLAAPGRLAGLMADYRPDRHIPAGGPGSAAARDEDPAGASLVVFDRNGMAVACAFTMNGLFGSARVAPGTGVILAALPGPQGRGPTSLAAMMVVNHHVGEFFFGAAASGGTAAPTAMVNVAARTLLEGMNLDTAMSAARVHHGGSPDAVYVEAPPDDPRLLGLDRRGHKAVQAPPLGLVNAGWCVNGLPPNPETCAVRTDPRGFGLAASTDR